MTRRQTFCLGVGAVVLLAGIGLQAGIRMQEQHGETLLRLPSAVPAHLEGWMVHDEPLGPTEAVTTVSVRTLNFDEYVYRSFTRGATRFEVYAAHWGSGKMPTRLVASHTPDRCWTENGMRCLEMTFKKSIPLSGVATPPAEWRVFETPRRTRINVVYWHLVDGQLYDYGDRFNAVANPFRWWKDVVDQAMFGSREQYFVRITSEQSFEDLLRDEGFRSVVAGLSGLSARPTPKT